MTSTKLTQARPEATQASRRSQDNNLSHGGRGSRTEHRTRKPIVLGLEDQPLGELLSPDAIEGLAARCEANHEEPATVLSEIVARWLKNGAEAESGEEGALTTSPLPTVAEGLFYEIVIAAFDKTFQEATCDLEALLVLIEHHPLMVHERYALALIVMGSQLLTKSPAFARTRHASTALATDADDIEYVRYSWPALASIAGRPPKAKSPWQSDQNPWLSKIVATPKAPVDGETAAVAA
jgi:hypothetical protein